MSRGVRWTPAKASLRFGNLLTLRACCGQWYVWLVVLLSSLALPMSAHGEAAGLPTGFSDSSLYTLGFYPTGLAVLNDGRVFLLSKSGDIWVYQNGVLLAEPLLRIPVDSQDERGLLGIALHPDFETNGYFFVFYVTSPSSRDYTGKPTSRVSRFQIRSDNPNRADPQSEIVLLDEFSSDLAFHVGGCLRIGPDRNLYISIGDGTLAHKAQELDSIHGKILRLNLDGSVPSDNPFVSQSGVRSEIWVLGLRNPFRCSIDPVTGELWIGDVGEQLWEELNRGAPGANYGWPLLEGPTPSGLSGFAPPAYSYPHDFEPHGGAIIVGPTYNGAMFPQEYAGNIFFSDWIR
ncbi:MAG: sorbosone dehydrogenase family protein, partial [Candidatus Korobacteraceae bacterium]